MLSSSKACFGVPKHGTQRALTGGPSGAMLSYSKACFGVPKHGTQPPPRLRFGVIWSASQGSSSMPRRVLLFSGQWTDMPLGELAPKLAEWGYQGIELVC